MADSQSTKPSINHLAIGMGLVAGLGYGLLTATTDLGLLRRSLEIIEPLGAVFVNAIKMVVIPLVATTIFTGVATLGNPRRLGRLGGLTLAFFWGTTLLAIALGMAVMTLALPLAPPVTGMPEAEQAVPALPSLVDFVVGLVPDNPFAAATSGALLPLIVFTILFGAAAGALPDQQKAGLMTTAEAITAALIKLVYWVLWTAPIGVFALAAPVTARSGWAMLASLAIFVGAVIAGLIVFVGAVYLPAVRLLARRSAGSFLATSVGSMVIGFTTTSSVASLPVLLGAVDELRLSRPVGTLVVSLGASLNRAGSALFQGASVVFLAAMYDVNIPVTALAGALLATFLVSLSIAPVPSASVMTLAPALETVGVPLAGLGVILGVDRVPDMFRTATNVLGHLVAATVVDRATRASMDGDVAIEDLKQESP